MVEYLTVVSSHGQWVWHPGEGRLSYFITDRGGGVTEGVTTFPDALTFVTVATRIGQHGRSSEHRDENVAVSDSVHRNETFDKVDGRWVSGGVYEWRRERR